MCKTNAIKTLFLCIAVMEFAVFEFPSIIHMNAINNKLNRHCFLDCCDLLTVEVARGRVEEAGEDGQLRGRQEHGQSRDSGQRAQAQQNY